MDAPKDYTLTVSRKEAFGWDNKWRPIPTTP